MRFAERMLMTLTPFRAQRNEHYNRNAIGEAPDSDQPVSLAGPDHRTFKKMLVQIGKIEPAVFGDVGQALRFIPDDLHDYYVDTI